MIPIKEFDFEKRRADLLQAKKSQIVSNFLDEKFNSLKIQDGHLSAIFAKQQGNYQKALNAYQELVAEKPESPYPHYYIAELLMKIDPQNSQIKDELNKASIKVELTPNLDFASLHILLGNFAQKQGNKNLAQNEYQKAFELGKSKAYILEELKDIYKKNKNEYDKIDVALKNLMAKKS
jgi:tetratricopeptide (TPR) repeat protein